MARAASHVERHLVDQRVDGLEALLAAQALEERELERLAVDVAVEVQEERLDELAAPGDERRAHADAHRGRGRTPSRAGHARDRGVHAVAGRHERGVGHDVRRRVAELAPALVAVRDLAGERERIAEQAPRVLDRAAEHEPADVARRDDLAVDLHQLDDPRLEARIGAQQVGVALRLVAEAEVLADRRRASRRARRRAPRR